MPTAVRHLIIGLCLSTAMWVASFVGDTIQIVPWLNKSVPSCHKVWAGVICRRWIGP